MAIKVKKGRRSASGLAGRSRTVLNKALKRMNPAPTKANWKGMARGFARQKGAEAYLDAFIEQHGSKLGWEWATLWITHTVMAENGSVDLANQTYEVITGEFTTDYLSEMTRGRMLRDYTGEYFRARQHLRYAQQLWPQGCEGSYQLGVLYDLLGVPEYAFAAAEQAYDNADQFGETAYKLKGRISYNMAVAMWQAARPYGDIKAYLRRALDDWPAYERAQNLLDTLPDSDDGDSRGRNPMQRLTDDIKKSINQPTFSIVEPDFDDD